MFARFAPKSLRRLARDRGGNVLLTFALTAPVVLIALGGGIDYARWLSSSADVQSAADTAALAGAKELRLANSNHAAVIAAARNRALASLGSETGDVTVQAEVQGNNAILVRIDLTSPSLFGWAPAKFSHIHAQSLARTASTPTCVIALNSGGKGLGVETAAITANGCATYSNSVRSDGLSIKSATITAAQTCSAGGVKIQTGVVLPSAITDCPVIGDPLASRPPPSFGACDHDNMVVTQGTITLSPGVYCGGLKVTGGASVHLSPGVYIITDGELSADQNASLQGDQVGFYLAGAKAQLDLDVDSTVNLVAPKDGPMAGILFFEDRSAPVGRDHQLGSRNAPQLLGTMYFPQGRLTVGQKGGGSDLKKAIQACAKLGLAYPCTPSTVDIAVLSAWTIVIANEFKVNFSVNLIFNTNYSSNSTTPPAEFAFKGATLTQ